MNKQEALNKIEELKRYIEKLDHNNEQWKPKEGEQVYSIDMINHIYPLIFRDNYDEALLAVNNCFPTREAAVQELLRRKAAAKKWLPEIGDKYWIWNISDNTVEEFTWNGWSAEFAYYWLGLVCKTDEEARAKRKEFRDAFKLPIK